MLSKRLDPRVVRNGLMLTFEGKLLNDDRVLLSLQIRQGSRLYLNTQIFVKLLKAKPLLVVYIPGHFKVKKLKDLIKRKVQSVRPGANLNLIYAGRILQDNSTVFRSRVAMNATVIQFVDVDLECRAQCLE